MKSDCWNIFCGSLFKTVTNGQKGLKNDFASKAEKA